MQFSVKNRFLNFCIRVVGKINGWVERCRIRVYAAQASFFITISALPFLILILTLAGLLIPREGGMIKEAILNRVPEEFSALVTLLLDEVSAKSNMQLISVSAVALLWSASRGIRGIGAGIRNVYGGKGEKWLPVYAARAVLYTLIYLLTVIMTLVIWVFGDLILSYTTSETAYVFLRLLNSGAFLIILSAVFALTYKGYAGRKVKFFSQLTGAFFSAIGWFLYSRFFEFYIENYANYSYIYGSLTSLIVVMLWLYACMEILLVGAGINTFLENRIPKKKARAGKAKKETPTAEESAGTGES